MLYFAFNTRGMTGVTDSSEVQDCALTEEINMSDTFEFTIHASNPVYKLIQSKITYVTVFDDYCDMDDSNNRGKVIFRGRVSTTKEDSGTAKKAVTCNDALSFLNDSFYNGPDVKTGQSIDSYFNTTYTMAVHNKALENDPFRTFLAFSKQNDNGAKFTDDISISGERTFDVLRALVDNLKWEFQLSYRLAVPHYTVTVAPYFGFKSRTPIVTGLNLKNLTKERDFGEFYTRIFPIGGYCYDEKRLQLYCQSSQEGNNYTFVDPTEQWPDYIDGIYRNQYVDNVKLVRKYGVYPKYVVYDDIVANSAATIDQARHNLYAKAYADAKKLTDRKETIQVNGYDLYRAGYPMDELKVHNYYQCIDTITGTVVKARLKKKTTYFDKPFEPSLTLEYDGLDEDSEVK
jgi:hypothetical protein